jgi:hypothetical protein
MVGLPQLVVDALTERMAAPGTAEDLVFAGPRVAPAGTLFRRRLWLPAVKVAGWRGCASMTCGPSAAPAGAERLGGPLKAAARRVDLLGLLVGVTGLEPVTSSLLATERRPLELPRRPMSCWISVRNDPWLSVVGPGSTDRRRTDSQSAGRRRLSALQSSSD